jgi:hypothetical protein
MNYWNFFLFQQQQQQQETIYSIYSFPEEMKHYLFQQPICFYEKEDDEYEIPTQSFITLGELMEPK